MKGTVSNQNKTGCHSQVSCDCSSPKQFTGSCLRVIAVLFLILTVSQLKRAHNKTQAISSSVRDDDQRQHMKPRQNDSQTNPNFETEPTSEANGTLPNSIEQIYKAHSTILLKNPSLKNFPRIGVLGRSPASFLTINYSVQTKKQKAVGTKESIVWKDSEPTISADQPSESLTAPQYSKKPALALRPRNRFLFIPVWEASSSRWFYQGHSMLGGAPPWKVSPRREIGAVPRTTRLRRHPSTMSWGQGMPMQLFRGPRGKMVKQQGHNPRPGSRAAPSQGSSRAASY
uniref:Uncharacterized protein n=1 Tax=Tetraselmis sp. GSL018 TaxID=582737 RepID=A0A061RJD9_9CHLO